MLRLVALVAAVAAVDLGLEAVAGEVPACVAVEAKRIALLLLPADGREGGAVAVGREVGFGLEHGHEVRDQR